MKRETLSWLAQSARFTQRYEDRIGLLCREMTVTRVAELNNLSWDQVWRMEKSYMRRLLERHPPSEHLRAIGVDEISLRKGHSYAIVVADLDQQRPIWLGGQGRAEEDLQLFFDQMGSERCKSIELAVMDMKFLENWKSQSRWQRLQPFEKFAAMIECHWDGIASYCHPDHKVSLGFMEGVNNKIRVIQRRVYGIGDQEYLMLKVITSFIKEPKST